MKSLKSIIAGVLVAASTTLPLLPQKTQAEDLPKPYVSTTFASAFVSPSGAAIEERCRQDWASISTKGLTFGIWQNQFKGEEGISERDYCLSYSRPIASNLTANVGVQYWDYPNRRFGNFDSVETAGLDYSGKVDVSLGYTHLNQNSVTENGERVYLKLSKPIKLVDGKTKVSITPSLATAWLDNYYGHNGHSQVSAGLSLGISKGKWGLNAAGTMQKAIASDIQNLNWGTVSLDYQF